MELEISLWNWIFKQLFLRFWHKIKKNLTGKQLGFFFKFNKI